MRVLDEVSGRFPQLCCISFDKLAAGRTVHVPHDNRYDIEIAISTIEGLLLAQSNPTITIIWIRSQSGRESVFLTALERAARLGKRVGGAALEFAYFPGTVVDPVLRASRGVEITVGRRARIGSMAGICIFCSERRIRDLYMCMNESLEFLRHLMLR